MIPKIYFICRGENYIKYKDKDWFTREAYFVNINREKGYMIPIGRLFKINNRIINVVYILLIVLALLSLFLGNYLGFIGFAFAEFFFMGLAADEVDYEEAKNIMDASDKGIKKYRKEGYVAAFGRKSRFSSIASKQFDRDYSKKFKE